ncbi:helix-turn-helix domain-containing protein [Dyadobacter sandarakinus]|uniref:AraC family transcriptional regulator n=1 Tax=Dyadobacter sandarakinus TaxID=2747268 RepID=A0ABX7I8T1_9BACT|nr:helix-turn-helix domain-containing protein [Dyadobacter sandarakinus]QRR01386.1 AraC family transcriptional regulator [Dyadobacter sandarakinus]
MTFYFNAYSSILLFGFLQGWIYALLFWFRGIREGRLSDRLLAGVLVALCFNIWVYMLGFGGIEILWQQLDFFPRTLAFLLPPLYYFYLRSQFDVTFRFEWKDLSHIVLFVVDAAYRLIVFAQGPSFVRYWENTYHNPLHLDDLFFVVGTGQHLLYLYWSFQLYVHYQSWIKDQFSNTEPVSFVWFRNFLIALALLVSADFMVTMLDLWLNLSFWEDWWNNLVGVVLIYYVSITGYAQRQPGRQLAFSDDPVVLPEQPAADAAKSAIVLTPEQKRLHEQLLNVMDAEKPYLNPDLSLADLARRMKLNTTSISQLINAGSGKNFNDFINAYRIMEFKKQVLMPAHAHLSLLGIALDCGFNSKATFNRAFKKQDNLSPGEFLAQHQQTQ